MDHDQRQDALNAVNQVENFFRQKGDSIATIEAIVTSAYNQFQRSQMKWYSPSGVSKQLAALKRNFYDQTIEDGKIVLVSLSPNEPQVATMLCTLVKCLYQRSVLSRLERVQHGHLQELQAAAHHGLRRVQPGCLRGRRSAGRRWRLPYRWHARTAAWRCWPPSRST